MLTAVISSDLTHGTVLCGGTLGPTNAHGDRKVKVGQEASQHLTSHNEDVVWVRRKSGTGDGMGEA